MGEGGGLGGKTFGKIAGIDVRGIIERKFYLFILIIERVESLVPVAM